MEEYDPNVAEQRVHTRLYQQKLNFI